MGQVYYHSTSDHPLPCHAGCAHSLHWLAHNSPHCGEMNAKFLRDLLIAVRPGLVRCPNRVVPILVLPTYGAELCCILRRIQEKARSG